MCAWSCWYCEWRWRCQLRGILQVSDPPCLMLTISWTIHARKITSFFASFIFYFSKYILLLYGWVGLLLLLFFSLLPNGLLLVVWPRAGIQRSAYVRIPNNQSIEVFKVGDVRNAMLTILEEIYVFAVRSTCGLFILKINSSFVRTTYRERKKKNATDCTRRSMFL